VHCQGHHRAEIEIGCGHEDIRPIDDCPCSSAKPTCDQCGTPWPCDTRQALDRVDKLEAHSTTLNTIGWKLAAALGHVPGNDGQVHADPEALAQQLIDRLAETITAANAQIRAYIASNQQTLADMRTIRGNLANAPTCNSCKPHITTALNSLGPLLGEAGPA